MSYDQELIESGKCPELVPIRTEDGMSDGRCMADIIPGGYACEGHTAEIESWRSLTEAERAYQEYQMDMRDW